MKAEIHPELHLVKVHCGCGNEFETYSTVDELRLEICGACHPFFTGKKRAMVTAGRVQRFEEKYRNVTAAPAKPAKKKAPAPKKAAPKPKAAAPKAAAPKAAAKAEPKRS